MMAIRRMLIGLAGTCAALACMAAGERRAEAQCPTSVSDVSLSNGAGWDWFTEQDGSVIDSGIPARGDAYDFGGKLFVDGVVFPATGAGTPEVGGQQLARSAPMSGLTVTRKFYVPPGEDWARWLDIFDNPTASAITVAISTQSNLGSDGSTTIQATGDSDTTWEIADRWIVTSDAGPFDPVMSHNMSGPGGLAPSSVSMTVFDCAGTPGIGTDWTLTVPAGGRVALMYFGGMSVAADPEAVALANSLDSEIPSMLTGLTAAELAAIVNWDLVDDILVFGETGAAEPFRNAAAATLTTLGHNVTNVSVLPADLSSFEQVWNFNALVALTASEQAALSAFISSGRGVYFTGERPCCETNNDAIEAILNPLLDVGGITLGGEGDTLEPHAFNPGASNGASTTPNVLGAFGVTLNGVGGMGGVAGTNIYATAADGNVVGGLWADGDFVSNVGRVVVLMDINWNVNDPDVLDITENVHLFLTSNTVVSPVCGNGATEGGETCDDGNTVTEECTYGQALCMVCDNTCQLAAGETDVCGDTTQDIGFETCDDGNTATEECAYGQASCTVCDATCQSAAGETDVCGDTTQDIGFETCDDGNTATEECAYGQASCTVCDGTCQSAAGETDVCGDTTQDIGFEECDTNGNSATCDVDCTFPGCSDGVENTFAEECDDNDPIDTNACTNVCELPVCGDGIVTPFLGEQCDDGNVADDDGCSSTCELDPVDFDADGILNEDDNCPFDANNNQFDSDNDGMGDACDDLDNDNHDGDDYDDDEDNCPFVPNDTAPDDQLDDDNDGVGNACDPTDGNDVDGDGDDNVADNCPFDANSGQEDDDGDGFGNVCDPLDDDDVDADGDDNDADNCPFDANADQADADGDGLGDACDPTSAGDTDLDGDGEDNDVDNCPFIANPDQDDADEDGLGDVCDDLDNSDVDGDGEPNLDDNCPFDANDDQEDLDGDGLGDACDDIEDQDQNVVVNGNGCDAGGGGSGLGALALIGLAVLLSGRRRRDARALLVLLVLLVPVTAGAQTTTFDAQLDPDRFILTSDPTSVGLTESADPLAARAMAVGLALRLGGAPLTVCVEDDNGDCTVEGDIVSDRIGMDLAYAMGFGRFGVHAQLPLILHQSSDFGPSMGEDGLASGGVGDLRLGGKAWLFRKNGLTLGADLTFSLPTNSGSFTGDAGTVIEPRGLATWRKGKISLAGSLGYGLRTSDQTVADLHVDDELLLAVAGEYAVLDKLAVGLALSSRVGLMSAPDEMMDPTNDAERLTEALASTRYWVTDAIAVEGGLGTALEAGYGAPAYRVLAGVRWTHRPKDKPPAPVIGDADHDGIFDPDDACVQDPEDKDSFEDTDGCPEDDDKDGIADLVDDCRAVPEDADGVEDDDGCPEDDDRDGIADAVDECRTEPEDPDGFEDTNGCPDPDNDQDTVLDADDQCPIEQETLNGFEDENGCPDERPTVVVTSTAVELDETIYFDLNKAKIKKKSHKLLDAVAVALKENADIRVKVEGHTDDTGTEAWNQELSELRAKAVMDYLIGKGVAADRLESAGYGASVPLVQDDTDKARAKNRRVEFKIIQ